MYSDIFMDVTSALSTLGEAHRQHVFRYGKWSSINWMNTPGAIYAGDTDTCWTGPPVAPNNIQVDFRGQEVIFRQPVNFYELKQVIDAASIDPFNGYGADGDSNWTYAKIKEWWSRRYELETEVERLYKEELALGEKYHYERERAIVRWRDYIADGMHLYLRVYSFFLEEHRIPIATDTLPDV